MIEILTSKVFDSIYSDETEWNSKKENSEKTQIDKGETTGVTVKSDESKEAEGVAEETSDKKLEDIYTVMVETPKTKATATEELNLLEQEIVKKSVWIKGKKSERMFLDISKFASIKADKVKGSDLADFLEMGEGDDEFTGGLGGDNICGNKGKDILYGNQGDDEIKGNMGDDIIYGGKDADSIYGNLDNDKLYGNIGNDYLYGGQGDDVIYAGQGDDYVYGNKGNDTLYGNKGADTFVCTKGFDVIKDFWGLDGDKISVASVANAVISEKDGSTLITSGEGQLLLEGLARQFFDESQYLV